MKPAQRSAESWTGCGAGCSLSAERFGFVLSVRLHGHQSSGSQGQPPALFISDHDQPAIGHEPAGLSASSMKLASCAAFGAEPYIHTDATFDRESRGK